MSLQFVARVPYLTLSEIFKIVAASFLLLFPEITCLLIVVGNITVVWWVERGLVAGEVCK